LEVVMLRA
jgi:hypothetical protein